MGRLFSKREQIEDANERMKQHPFLSPEGQEREGRRMCRETMPCPECGIEMRENAPRCPNGHEL